MKTKPASAFTPTATSTFRWFAGIVVFAFGLETALHHVEDHLEIVPAFALCGGVALVLSGQVGFMVLTRSALSGSPDAQLVVGRVTEVEPAAAREIEDRPGEAAGYGRLTNSPIALRRGNDTPVRARSAATSPTEDR